MKTPCALPLAVLAVAATIATAHPTHRHLQNFPPANGQGQFRPGPMGPNAGGFQPQFGNVPMQGNGFGQFPAGGQIPGMQNGAPNMGIANTQTLGAGEADVTGAGSAVSADAPSSPQTDSAAVAPSQGTDAAGASATLTPGEPTIMVIFPDSVGAHSSGSSYSSDVGETKTPSTEKPAEADKPAETSAAHKDPSTLSALALLTTAVACAAALGLTP